MAEITTPKPYRDFYVTDPIIQLEENVLLVSDMQHGVQVTGKHTLEGKPLNVSVESKNLLPFPYSSTDVEMAGGTLTIGEDGGITGSGTPTDYTGMFLNHIDVEPNTVYTIYAHGTFTNMTLDVVLRKGNESLGNWNVHTGAFTFNTSNYPDATRMTISVKRSANGAEMSGTLYPQIEKGCVASSYSKYVEDGTPVTVTTCGKNLLNVPSVHTWTGVKQFSCSLRKGIPYTLSTGSVTEGGSVGVRMYFGNGTTSVFSTRPTSNQTVTFTLTNDVDNISFYSNGTTATTSEGITSTINQLMIEEGHCKTSYEPYSATTQQTSVGEEISITQLNETMNLISSNTGVSLSTQFVLSNEELLNDKATVLVGTFANRPTNMQPYPRIYIATDKTDTTRTTYLPANVSGATASNWIYL